MKYEEMIITPSIAEEMLLHNGVNRTLNYNRVNQYADDMKSGKWQLNGECIKFYADGSLCDGQHRLKAIVSSGVPVKIGVMRDVMNDVTIQDRGRNRSLTDSMLLEGIDRSVANNTIVGIARLHFYLQFGNVSPSDGEVKSFIFRNSNLLSKIMHVARRDKNVQHNIVNIRNSPVLLACFYAVNCGACDFDILNDFIFVLKSGMPTKLNQTAAIVCRNDMLSRAIDTTTNSVARVRAEKQIERALSDFINNKNRKQTYANCTDPIFSNIKKNREA